MRLSNGKVLEQLTQVRNRQIPWFKNASVFVNLKALGLLGSRLQQAGSGTGRPHVEIAVLTDLGRAEFERLKRLENKTGWADFWRSTYDLFPGDS